MFSRVVISNDDVFVLHLFDKVTYLKVFFLFKLQVTAAEVGSPIALAVINNYT